ncbi:MAG: YicC family protein [Candidatus Brocadiia bacterium]|nr:MAG: YicC family protein [Candidatus Brocadiia bacterium]
MFMIYSMTGYGQSQEEVNGVGYAVEIKAVNNRYLKTNIKMPDVAAFLEDDIEKLIRQHLSRGTVSFYLNMKSVSGYMPYEIDQGVLRGYLKCLANIQVSKDIPCRVEIGGLLSLPGVLVTATPDEETIKATRNTVLRLTAAALEQVRKMRSVEGQALYTDLEANCMAVSGHIAKIRCRGEVVLQEYQSKLKRRVDSLLSQGGYELDKETLAREVAIYADRSDVSEELARLESHIEQFYESARSNLMAGRKLDFISQEMLREANTIASKSNDTLIMQSVVEIKCHIDRIKEQVQNVE